MRGIRVWAGKKGEGHKVEWKNTCVHECAYTMHDSIFSMCSKFGEVKKWGGE